MNTSDLGDNMPHNVQFVELLEQMGIPVYEADGSIRCLYDIFNDIADVAIALFSRMPIYHVIQDPYGNKIKVECYNKCM